MRFKSIPTLTPEQEERFWSHVDVPYQPSCCWEWVGRRLRNRYGAFSYFAGPAGSRKQLNLAAHRVAYRVLVGPIPDGLVLDHLCRNVLCVNPDHLRPVVERVNLLSGFGAAALNARKTHCKRGHELTDETIYWQGGTRQCRICRNLRRLENKDRRNESNRRYRERNRDRLNAEHRERRARLRDLGGAVYALRNERIDHADGERT